MNRLISFKKCIDQRLLRRITPSLNNADRTIEKAEHFLREAKKNIENGQPASAASIAYLSFFNAARALLLADGYREKSHMCVLMYLRHKYQDKLGGDNLSLFSQYMSMRHKTQYDSVYYPTMDEARNTTKFAETFIDKIWSILETKK